jgi:glycosyltransferase involved in cell wall biosynthesis
MTPVEGSRRRPRIACLATHGGHSGGAAIAMERLVVGLRGAGAEVGIVTRATCPWPNPVRRLDRRIRRRIRHGRTPVSNTLFTADWPAWDLAGHPAVTRSEFVNVHWVAGFLAAEGIRRLVASGRPVAWTLHDMRPFTGGCHYAAGCEGFTGDCQGCPQLVPAIADLAARGLARSRRRLHGVPLTFITPSLWLAGELSRSSLFDPECHAVRVIPNGIDLEQFAPGDRARARQELGLPAAGTGILLGSVSLDEHRKGGDVAMAALGRLAADVAASSPGGPQPFVVTYGAGGSAELDLPCRHLGTVDEAGVRRALHACDLHLTMAREDNLPNTVMEAMACGVPVVAAAAGGLPEMIAPERSGWLVPVDAPEAAAAILGQLVRDPARVAAAGREARRHAEAAWDVRIQAERYLALAGDLMADPAAAGSGGMPAHSGGVPSPLTPAVAPFAHPAARLRAPLRQLRRTTSRPWRRAA